MKSSNTLSFGSYAPLIAGIVLLGVGLHSPFTVRAHTGAQRYFNEVREAINAFPYKIGPWLGSDMDVAPAAVRLLQPNALEQRLYTNMHTGARLQVLLVHCGDTRDMQGHYPPICYPAHGWKNMSSENVSVTIRGESLPARRYHFSRLNDGVTSEMTIINFFVVPSSSQQFHGDIGALDRASRDQSAAGLGAAQLQIVSTGTNVDPLADGSAQELLDGLEPVLRVIAGGVSDDADRR